ncbi:MAG: radical protein [Chthoniobacteraceae bacterium]|nr:radical protein [Chthoniobacteraceae bacterium]
MNHWSILYRGPLSSCNYSCDYCPFAKLQNTREELLEDGRKLSRFVDWVEKRTENIGVLFTPWGEALFHRTYQTAIIRLSHQPHVRRVVIQTNLSCSLDWLNQCDKSRVALWTTYHPTQTALGKFVAQCESLDRIGVRHSVGVVGLKDHAKEIEVLRAELNPATYLWINAYKRLPDYYSETDLARFRAIDPHFDLNVRRHASHGKACRAGSTAFTVDGDGAVRRCHFIKEPIGNIYTPEFETALRVRPCSNSTCGCHIGYVHMEEPDLYSIFGENVLERIPAFWPTDELVAPRSALPCPA